MEDLLLWLSPVAGILALLFAWYLAANVARQDAGTPKMKEIAAAIQEGAMAFLRREYRTLAIFVAALFVILIWQIDVPTGISFLGGALSSIVAGFIGMSVATKANVRTAAAARFGQNKALAIAFSGGAVMGMSVVGLGLFGVSTLFIIFRALSPGTDLTTLVGMVNGFALGASSIALFARVGGGIYTKAADVGADLVGKVEAGIPEDDP
ncbi:MAG: sodium/proton-translocating pyrophosphatase, partial [Bacillota bacterium]|nr:sodium/proton-translocating pyrophosphatase [Bacillota bacterium]